MFNKKGYSFLRKSQNDIALVDMYGCADLVMLLARTTCPIHADLIRADFYRLQLTCLTLYVVGIYRHML